MNKIYTFGCSLTANSWPKNLAKSLGYDLENFALGAGDNITQYRRFQDLYMNNQINKNDYFIWEVTYLNRTGFRLSPDHHFYTKNKENPKVKHNFHLSKFQNILDNKSHIDYVAFNNEWYDVVWYTQNIDQMLSELLYNLKICNEISNNNLIVWFAENNIFEFETQKKNFINFLDKQKIKHLNYESESLMSWVKDNNYYLDQVELHPTPKIYELFVNKFIKPIIKNENI
jgi:hypothetical protein